MSPGKHAHAARIRALVPAGAAGLAFLALLPWAGAPTTLDLRIEAWLDTHVAARGVWLHALSWPGSLAAGLGVSLVAIFVRRRAAFAWLALAWAWRGLAWVLKQVIERPRPGGPETFAFPSGHATSAAVVLIVATAVLLGARAAAPPGAPARSDRGGRLRAWPWTLIGALVVLTGLGRVVGGVHWTTDVLAGWAFGATGALGLLAAMQRFDRPRDGARGETDPPEDTGRPAP